MFTQATRRFLLFDRHDCARPEKKKGRVKCGAEEDTKTSSKAEFAEKNRTCNMLAVTGSALCYESFRGLPFFKPSRYTTTIFPTNVAEWQVALTCKRGKTALSDNYY